MKKYNWGNDNYTLNYFFLDCYCQFTLVSCQATFHFLRKDQTSICFGVNLKFQFPLLHWLSNKPKISVSDLCVFAHIASFLPEYPRVGLRVGPRNILTERMNQPLEILRQCHVWHVAGQKQKELMRNIWNDDGTPTWWQWRHLHTVHRLKTKAVHHFRCTLSIGGS